MKNDVAKAEPRTIPALDRAIVNATKNVTASDAKGWFKNCGVAYQIKR